MSTHGTWHRRGLVIVAATSVIGSLTTWATQAALSAPVSPATVRASPYFAGAVTSPGLMHSGHLYTESGRVTFVVPTVTCSASQDTSYALFQLLEDGPGETGYAGLNLECESGTFSAGIFSNADTGNGTSGDCGNVPVTVGDSITVSEQDSIFWQHHVIPAGEMNVSASDTTNGESTECSSPTMLMPDGSVYTGMCDSVPPTGPVPPDAPPPPPTCIGGSAEVSAFTPFSLSSLKVDNKQFWHWPTHQYDLYRYRQVGSTLKPIEQVQTQRVDNALDFTFLHQ